MLKVYYDRVAPVIHTSVMLSNTPPTFPISCYMKP